MSRPHFLRQEQRPEAHGASLSSIHRATVRVVSSRRTLKVLEDEGVTIRRRSVCRSQGAGTSSPPQFVQIWFITAVHVGQNVHSYEHMKAAPSTVSRVSQHSHRPSISRAIGFRRVPRPQWRSAAQPQCRPVGGIGHPTPGETGQD